MAAPPSHNPALPRHFRLECVRGWEGRAKVHFESYLHPRLLGVRVGTPLLRRERTVLDTGRRPMEFGVVHCRCDRFRLTLNLRQE